MTYQQFRQKLLMDRTVAVLQSREFAFIVIYQRYVMAHLCETSARHKPHITRPNHSYFHPGSQPLPPKSSGTPTPDMDMTNLGCQNSSSGCHAKFLSGFDRISQHGLGKQHPKFSKAAAPNCRLIGEQLKICLGWTGV